MRLNIFTCRFFSTCSSGHRKTPDSALKDQADTPSPSPNPTPSPSASHSLPIQSIKSAGSVVCFQDSPSPPPLQSLSSPRQASQGLRLFDWSSHVLSTKHSNMKVPEEISASVSKTSRDQSAARTNTDSSEETPDSPLSQDSAYWSQSQLYKSPYYRRGEAVFQEDAACVS